MKKVALGNQGLEVSRIGLGCMGMSEFYGPSDRAKNLAALHFALDHGMTFWDTADMYGVGENERLVAEVLKERRDEVQLATKFAIVRTEDGAITGVNGRPDYVKQACDASLKRLGIDTIDLYYQHRVDPDTPIEDTVGAMKELVEAGKVRCIGLSEAGVDTIRRAHKVHPITALQSEYSLWSRDPEDEHLACVRELGIGFVAYSPLGRGFLTGQIRSMADLDETDWRRFNPRFQGDNFQKNLDLVDAVHGMAKEKGCTAAQLALAWLLRQGDDIVPIPGTRHADRIAGNIAACDVDFTDADLIRMDEIAPHGVAEGLRYPEIAMQMLNL
jgi:aryl-alcohol dehydrogenase-like predicted oxidoreductase